MDKINPIIPKIDYKNHTVDLSYLKAGNSIVDKFNDYIVKFSKEEYPQFACMLINRTGTLLVYLADEYKELTKEEFKAITGLKVEPSLMYRRSVEEIAESGEGGE